MCAVSVVSSDLHDILSLSDNCILIDWFSLSQKFPCDDSDIPFDGLSNALEFASEILGLDSVSPLWLHLPGFHGFSKRLYYNGISIHYDGSEKMGLNRVLWCEMSGQGCRAYEEYSSSCDWFRLFSLPVYDDCFHCSRLDIAYDDYTGVLDIDILENYLKLGYYVSNFRDFRCEYSFVSDDKCIYYGSKKSDIMFRCYNKAAERQKSDVIPHWVRFEVQLRDDRALAFIKAYLDCENLGACFSGVVDKCFRYVEPSEGDTNKRRWSIPSWWTEFLGLIHAIPDFTKKDTEYNEMRLESYVIGSAGAAIDTYITINGLDKFMKAVKKQANKKLNIKYEGLKRSAKLQDDIWSSSKDLSEVFARLNSAGLIS